MRKREIKKIKKYRKCMTKIKKKKERGKRKDGQVDKC